MARLPRMDVLLAFALAVPSVAQVTLIHPIASRPVGVVVALGSTLPIAWRQVRPVAAALVAAAVWLVPADGYLYLGFLAAFVVFYSLAAQVADVRVVATAAALGLAATVGSAAMRGDVVGEYFAGLPAVAIPVGVGRVVRRLRAQAERLSELTVLLEAERERAEQAAVADERARIARELHDVVAHGVSVIAIQADAAEAALDRDPEIARAPLRAIRRSAKEVLGEMRHLLGMLREDRDGGELAPQPGLGQLDELLERARGAGVDVTLAVDGAPRPLPAGLDLSAYRIVQEGLTNVRKHAAGAPARVRVSWAPRELTVEVRDDGPGGTPDGSGGHGVVGMRERARLHGGELRVGPVNGGGFVVRARLPLEERRP